MGSVRKQARRLEARMPVSELREATCSTVLDAADVLYLQARLEAGARAAIESSPRAASLGADKKDFSAPRSEEVEWDKMMTCPGEVPHMALLALMAEVCIFSFVLNSILRSDVKWLNPTLQREVVDLYLARTSMRCPRASSRTHTQKICSFSLWCFVGCGGAGASRAGDRVDVGGNTSLSMASLGGRM